MKSSEENCLNIRTNASPKGTGPGVRRSKVENVSSVSPACHKRRLNRVASRNNRIKRLTWCLCLDGHVNSFAANFLTIMFSQCHIYCRFITPSLLASACLDTFRLSLFNFLNYIVWLRITEEGSVPEMRIWSILLIISDLKWCIHLSRSLFLYFNYLVSVTAGGPESPRGHM